MSNIGVRTIGFWTGVVHGTATGEDALLLEVCLDGLDHLPPPILTLAFVLLVLRRSVRVRHTS